MVQWPASGYSHTSVQWSGTYLSCIEGQSHAGRRVWHMLGPSLPHWEVACAFVQASVGATQSSRRGKDKQLLCWFRKAPSRGAAPEQICW